MENIKDNYTIEYDGVKLEVEIRVENKELLYHMTLPKFEFATQALMKNLRERVAQELYTASQQSSEAIISRQYRKQLTETLGRWITEIVPQIDAETKSSLIISIMNKSFGLGEIEYLLKDSSLEEIVINSINEPVRVYHKKYGWLKSNVWIDSEDEIQRFAKGIARFVGTELTIRSPLLDAHLPNGDRINTVLNQLSDKGTSMTIRMFARQPWTMTDFLKSGTVNEEILAIIWVVSQYELNMMISGGTGSGKTSLLNIILPFIQPNQRIVSIEDTRELQLPEFLYWYPMRTRKANQEGEGEVTMGDLLVNSLRMRPDRIVLGEIRRGEDAAILFEAMHTGHSVYATLHADTAAQTIRRLINPPIDIHPTMVEALNLNAVMFRDRRAGIRRVSQLAEIIPSEVGNEVTLKANVLYKWRARTDDIVKNSDDIRLFQDISLHTGLTKSEINEDLKEKKKILKWLVKNELRSLNEIGQVMRVYYMQKDDLVAVVDKKQDPARILE